jgi:predicted DNA binding protein
MIELTLDVEQYDCPFIDTTDDHEVGFRAVNWEYDATAGTLDTRMIADAPDRETLDGGLGRLRDHDRMLDYELVSRRGGIAQIRTTIPTTDAMGAIQSNDGFVAGPFEVDAGSERWQVGFDAEGDANAALSALDRDNEFEVLDRDQLRLDELQGFVGQVGAAMTLVEGCRDLSETERRTLEAAVEGGYFSRPRDADLGTLADEFDVSKPAVSSNLRRGQERVLERVVDALERLDTEGETENGDRTSGD